MLFDPPDELEVELLELEELLDDDEPLCCCRATAFKYVWICCSALGRGVLIVVLLCV
jgi:hypothetical protein